MKRQMKSILSLMLALVMILSLGAGVFAEEAKEENQETEEVVEEEVAEEAAEEEAAEEEAEEEEAAEETEEPVAGGTFVVAIGAEPEAYNPSFGNPDMGYIVVQNIMNKLVKMNVDNEIVPDLAKGWTFSDDGLTLTFYLNEGIKWHDGEPFTSEDVKFTFEKAIEVEGFASNTLSKFKEINTPDENTVELVLEEPDATVVGRLAWMGTYIMPKHIYEEGDVLENPANQAPIGTGPFKFVEQVPGETITIERNEEFFGEKALLDKVIFKIMPDQMSAHQAWLAGEIDDNRLGVPAAEMDALKEQEGIVNFPMDFPNMAGIVFNMQEGQFTDVKVREAILYGIDAKELVEKHFKNEGKVAKYFVPYQYAWALNEEAVHPERDVEKAMALLEEAGFEKNEEGYYLETTVDTYPGWDEFVPLLTAQLKEIGIKLNHNSMDDPSYDAKIIDEFDFELTLLGGYIGPDISAINNKFMTDGGMNYGKYSNEKVDELLKKGTQAFKEEERAEIYKEVQSILREELPIVFFRDFGYTAFLKDYVKGHPSNESRKTSSEYELTSVWLKKDAE